MNLLPLNEKDVVSLVKFENEKMNNLISKLSKYSPLKLKFSLIIFRNADTQVLRIFFEK